MKCNKNQFNVIKYKKGNKRQHKVMKYNKTQ